MSQDYIRCSPQIKNTEDNDPVCGAIHTFRYFLSASVVVVEFWRYEP